MTFASQPDLEPGRAYRTREFRRWGANPTRLARRLVGEGKLREAAHGLFYAPFRSRFGDAPASEAEILRAFLDDTPFVITGPPRWNALGLGSTSMFAAALVYNTRRTGDFLFDGRRFLLRRVLFPENPPLEWFVIDLLQHHEMAGASLVELAGPLPQTPVAAGIIRIGPGIAVDGCQRVFGDRRLCQVVIVASLGTNSDDSPLIPVPVFAHWFILPVVWSAHIEPAKIDVKPLQHVFIHVDGLSQLAHDATISWRQPEMTDQALVGHCGDPVAAGLG